MPSSSRSRIFRPESSFDSASLNSEGEMSPLSPLPGEAFYAKFPPLSKSCKLYGIMPGCKICRYQERAAAARKQELENSPSVIASPKSSPGETGPEKDPSQTENDDSPSVCTSLRRVRHDVPREEKKDEKKQELLLPDGSTRPDGSSCLEYSEAFWTIWPKKAADRKRDIG